MGINRVRSVVRVCENCRQEYHPWRATRPSHFCSNECAVESGKTGAPRKYPDRICEECGATFRSKSTKNASRFCTRECYRASGGKTLTPQGYALAYDKQYSKRKNGQILEHRLVMSQHLGRALETHETVHHINGDKADNRIENLQLRRGRHGRGVQCICGDCGSTNIQTLEL